MGHEQVWNVPYARNPIFTGREQLLTQLAEALHTGTVTALSQPHAISGLGGIGKTQIAVEYAYQHRQDYHAILWTRADTSEALVSGYVEIANVLNLPQKDEQDQTLVVNAVLQWLKTQTGWLLILDNADDLRIVSAFLPPAPGGHILLTTRAQAMGRLAKRLEVETMETDTGALLLLRRAGLIAADASFEAAAPSDTVLARALTQELGGLPLALDQAGAYIEEIPCSLLEYQTLYRTHRATLLRKRGGLVGDHPEPVATTWSLSFQQVEQQNAAAADLLRFCAYLAPDAIPEELIITGAKHLGPRVQPLGEDLLIFHDALAILGAYSLVRRDINNKTMNVHRLVQAVLKEQMDEQNRAQWAERAVRAVEAALPPVEHGSWSRWEELLAHALACAQLIEHQHMRLAEDASLLHQTGWYLVERARYPEAQPLLEQALQISEQAQGVEHLDTARDTATLAYLYQAQGKYVEAEPLYERALAIREQQLGAQHPDTAQSLNNLALLYQNQGQYALAEPLFVRALAICEQQLGPEHPFTATSLNNFALLYQSQGKFTQAEPLFVRALAIHEQQLGAQHPDTAQSLNNLALLYQSQGKFAEAEPLFVRALAIREQQLGPEHPYTATNLNNLALLYQSQGKFTQAEPLFVRALAIYEQQLGPEHPFTATSLNNLAHLYQSQGKFTQAEPLFVRALAIYEQQLGAQHPDTAQSLNNLAALYQSQGKFVQAEPLYERALAIREQQLGTEHPDTAQSLNNLAGLYRSQGKYTQAEPLYERALAICEQQLGTEHPDTATSLNNLAGLYRSQGKFAQAEPLYVRALATREQQLGAEHPDTATSLNNLALLYQSQGKFTLAEPLYERALAICESILGQDHPTTETVRANYNFLLQAMEDDGEAKP